MFGKYFTYFKRNEILNENSNMRNIAFMLLTESYIKYVGSSTSLNTKLFNPNKIST